MLAQQRLQGVGQVEAPPEKIPSRLGSKHLILPLRSHTNRPTDSLSGVRFTEMHLPLALDLKEPPPGDSHHGKVLR
jgi:hypothetical protein